jgi:hypothetical protein
MIAQLGTRGSIEFEDCVDFLYVLDEKVAYEEPSLLEFHICIYHTMI